MAILSNVNGKFAVDSTGAIQFSGSAGTSGYILRSNGNAAPTWVDSSTVIGGPYLPLTGGTLIGALAGTSATFTGNVIISGTLTIGGNSAITRSGSTAQGRLAIWQNDTAIKGNNNLFYASQYLTVGVGTTGGYAGLRINAGSVGELYLDFTEGASFTKRAQIQVDTNDNMYFRNTSSNSLRMTLLSGGNFGIGTTSPSTKLDVRGGSGGGSFDHATFTSVTNRGLKISTANSSEGQNGAAVIYNAQDGENYGSHAFQVGGSTKMFIKGNNVGIGETSPQRPLHINGTEGAVRFTSTASGNSGFEVGIGTASQAFLWQTENSYMHFATNSVERMRIQNDGNVGINLTNLTLGGFSPKLALKQTSDVVWGGINIESAVDDSILALGNDGGRHQIGASYRATAGYKPIDIMTSGSIRMTVLAGGNVGIGVTSPGQKLDVAGIIRSKGSNNYENILTKEGSTGSFTFTYPELNAGIVDNVNYFIFVSVYRPTFDVANDVGTLLLHGIMPRGGNSVFNTINTLKGVGISVLTATNSGNSLVITTDSNVNLRCAIKLISIGGTS